MSSYTLRVRAEDGKTLEVLRLDDDADLTVGRLDSNRIHLDEMNVSRKHVRFYLKEDELWVEDTSRYGTKVNGERLRGPRPVSNGDVVLIGDFEVNVQSDRPGSGTVPAGSIPNLGEGEARVTKERPKPQTVESAISGLADTQPAERTSVVNLAEFEAAEAARSRRRVAAEHHCLYLVSTDQAGARFDLVKPESVVGRTPENDVVINHRSVSGNHAKILKNGDQITVVDLDSANGIKINGDYYKESVLRDGDVVDLGHVKARYVAKGSTFVFDPAEWRGGAAAADNKSKRLLLIILLLLVLVGIGVAWFLTRGSGDPEPKPAGVSEAEGADKADDEDDGDEDEREEPPEKVEPKAAPDADVPPIVAAPKTSIEAKAAILAGRLALDDADWDAAVTAFSKAAVLDEGNVAATDGMTKATAERRLAKAYDPLKTAFDAGKYQEVWDKIDAAPAAPDDSYYADKFAELKADTYAKIIEALVQKARDATRPRDKLNAANEALALDPSNEDALALKAQAAKKIGASSGGGSRPKPRDDSSSGGGGDSATAGMSGKDLYQAGRKVHLTKPGQALQLYQKAAKKGYSKAYKMMGLLYTSQGAKSKAISAYKKYLRSNPSDAEQIKKSIRDLGGTP